MKREETIWLPGIMLLSVPLLLNHLILTKKLHSYLADLNFNIERGKRYEQTGKTVFYCII